MLLARALNFIFAYDLKSKKYYFRGISDSASSSKEVYASQPFVSQNGNVESMVFFNNPSLSAEGFDTGKLMWECDEVGGSKMGHIYLTRQNGDIDSYLGFLGKYGKLYLAEIGTGVIKAAYDIENLPFYSYKDFRIIDEKGVFIQMTSNDLLKVKISVQ
jgi:hypothetical protein